MSIGVFAGRSGLTPSALRFYADSALLVPAEVDPVSGYRLYRPDQLPRADMLRQLREIGMPLASVRAALDAGPAEAARMIDQHIAKVLGDAAAAQRQAVRLTAALTDTPGIPIAALKGPVLADAVDQVSSATAREPSMPVLDSIHIEAGPHAITLTATDRYRLSTRSLVPGERTAATWSATVDAGDLRAAANEMRRCATVHVEASAHGIRLRVAERDDLHCRLVTEPFPDYRAMLADLPEPTTRVTVAKNLLLRALEESAGEQVSLSVTDGVPEFLTGDEQSLGSLDATATGADVRITFQLTTFYPAISTAIGPDVMLDLRGWDLPVTVRSADRGDLTTTAMPIDPDHTT
ncbi:MerR family transcriptional regulator [Rhodococcus sp. O3]|uniref:DNA polymerase III subunit beta family protein n=1 Tax=Rhodococcus sp. O3 TaxID=3404919 RepID=UPI003B6719DD